MSAPADSPRRGLAGILVGWAMVCAVVAATLPLMPPDETRYVTAAWEMRLQHNWLLPTLNFTPYANKPPLLFWLINLAWTLAGEPAVWSARLVPFLVGTGCFLATFGLAARLFPARTGLPLTAALVLAASPWLYIYGALIMFDLLIALLALLAAVVVWRAAHTARYRALLLWGVCVGLGLLAKGPVILLHTLGPPLLAPLWRRPGSLARWYALLFAGLLVAAALALAWAVPAALLGGPEYSERLFWTEPARHIFQRQSPLWFYLPLLPLTFLPLAVWPAWWRACRLAGPEPAKTPGGRFLLCWIGPALAGLCLISGKQVHYLVPLLPAAAIYAAAVLDHGDPGGAQRGGLGLPCVVFALPLLAMLLAPVVAPQLPWPPPTGYVRASVDALSPALAASALAVTGLLYLWSRRATGLRRLVVLALLLAVFAVHGHAQAATTFYSSYDLTPVAAAVRAQDRRPLAFVRSYHGGVGFLARRDTPFEPVRALDALPAWFAAHPDGAAVVRYKDEAAVREYHILFSMPYRTTEFMALVELRRGSAQPPVGGDGSTRHPCPDITAQPSLAPAC